MAADTVPSLPDLHAQMLGRVVAAVPEALKRSAALYVELRAAEPPPWPVKGMPGLLLDFIDGKQSRA